MQNDLFSLKKDEQNFQDCFAVLVKNRHILCIHAYVCMCTYMCIHVYVYSCICMYIRILYTYLCQFKNGGKYRLIKKILNSIYVCY